MKYVKVAVVGVVATALVVGASVQSFAAPARIVPVKVSAARAVTVRFSDRDIAELLMTGYGPAAVAAPRASAALRAAGHGPLSPKVIDALYAALRKVDPGFHDKVALKVQAHDPQLARQGVERFIADIKSIRPYTDPTGPNCGILVVVDLDQNSVAVTTAKGTAKVLESIIGLVAYRFNYGSGELSDAVLAAELAREL
jgi:hypothetical protein